MNPRTTLRTSRTFAARRLAALLPLVGLLALCGDDSAPAAPAAAAAAPAPPAFVAYTETVPGTDARFDMVPIPGGSFMMGSPAGEKGRKDDEGPRFEVRVEPFYMGKHEVTWAEYVEFLKNYDRLGAIKGRPRVPREQLADAVTYPTPLYEQNAAPILQRMGRGPNFPAVIMSQFAARQYTKWLSKKTGRFYRLPTEAEWEYACRAGTATAYSFGDDPEPMDEHGWNYDNSVLKDEKPAYREVGKLKPNAWGLYDMHGNVAEWTLDQYAPDWYKQFEGKSVNWDQAVNWPTKQYPRVVRGGGYESDAEDCRSAWRYGTRNNDNKSDPQVPRSPHWLSEGFWIGFRVVSPAKEPATEAERLKYWNPDDPTTERIVYGRDREIHELIDAPAAGK